MAEIINLRRARKAKERAGREQTAAEKRRLFGRSKTQKLAEAAERERTERTLAAHRRDSDDKPE
jgi:Domain of unknown function (DUF4169)